MAEEGLGLTEFIVIALFYVLLALALFFRLAKGPGGADRAVAADSIDILATVALVMFSIFTGRAIYLDVALVTALLGFIGTTLIGRYLGGRL